MDHAYQQKWAKYGYACSSEGISFQPLPFEVLGGVLSSAVEVIKKIGKALARSSGQDESDTIKHLFGRLSLLLMRGNSMLILSRSVKASNPHIDGVQ